MCTCTGNWSVQVIRISGMNRTGRVLCMCVLAGGSDVSTELARREEEGGIEASTVLYMDVNYPPANPDA